MSLLTPAPSGGVTPKKALHEWLQDLESQLTRIPQDLGVVKSLVDAALSQGLVNDRKFVQLPCLDFDIDYND